LASFEVNKGEFTDARTQKSTYYTTALNGCAACDSFTSLRVTKLNVE